VDDFVAVHAEAVYRYALRLTRSPQQAEDLMQETLLRGWRRRKRLREAAAARVWLLRIATNIHRDGLRVARPWEPLIEPVIADPGHVPADAQLDHRECVERAMASIDQLPERQRQVIHLITIEQLSHEEAAEVLGTSLAAVKASLSLARRTMREKLRDVYDEIRGARTP
jgi:RNA polymerase sigma-70 factor (ECF subfamily)